MKRIISIIYKAINLFLCIFGLIIQLGILDNNINLSSLNYFTLLSNIWVAIVLVIFIYFELTKKDTAKLMWAKGSATISITLTMVVAYFMLRHTFDQMGGWMPLGMDLLHVYGPLMFILDYFLFDKKGLYKNKDIIAWAAFPIVYVIYAMVVANVLPGGMGIFTSGSRYPYPFLDTDLFGWPRVLITILIMAACYIFISWLYVKLDHLLAKNKKA